MLEKDILKSCTHRLDYWQSQKIVVWWDRYNSGGSIKNTYTGTYVRQCKKGTPDLIAYIKTDTVCSVCFFEVKRPGNKQSQHQVEFMMKFKPYSNVWYDVVYSPDEIDYRIEHVTGHLNKQLKDMDNAIFKKFA